MPRNAMSQLHNRGRLEAGMWLEPIPEIMLPGSGVDPAEYRAEVLNPEGGHASVRSRWGVESLNSLLGRMEDAGIACGVHHVHRNFRLVGHTESLGAEADRLA